MYDGQTDRRTDNRQWSPSDGKNSPGLWSGELKIEGKTLLYKELFDNNNFIFIKDILDEENKFKTYD